jgi:hypothetical protein
MSTGSDGRVSHERISNQRVAVWECSACHDRLVPVDADAQAEFETPSKVRE